MPGLLSEETSCTLCGSIVLSDIRPAIYLTSQPLAVDTKCLVSHGRVHAGSE